MSELRASAQVLPLTPAPTNVPANPPAPAVETAVLGRVDAVYHDRVLGWAWDRKAPKERLEIEVRLGDQVLATTLADRHRNDLQTGGIGDGRHAFDVRFEKTVPADRKGDVRAYVRPRGNGAPIVLGNPSPVERTAEALVAPHLIQIAQNIETLGGSLRQTTAAQTAATDALRTAIANSQNGQTEALARLAKQGSALAEGQDALRDQISSIEVFILRIDEALRALAERPAPTASGAGLSRLGLVGALLAATLAGVVTTLIATGSLH